MRRHEHPDTTPRILLTGLLAGLLLACPDPKPTPPADAGCEPMTCEGAGKQCGEAPDGCGGTLACGGCPAGMTCGGDGLQNVCVPGSCTPKTCPELACGTWPDGCGGTLACGPCAEGQTCSADREGTCEGGCAETNAAFCQRLAKNCGQVSGTDLCGEARTADCGSCTDPQTCGGGGIENLCGCRPKTCDELGVCGRIFDGCSRTLDCACAAPLSCGGGGVDGQCGCVPTSCEEQGVGCGEAYDGCGQMIDCGTCPSGSSPPPLPLRVMAANTSSGNYQSYDPGEGIRIFQGLAPDVVLIQEFSYGDDRPSSIRAMVDLAFGPNFYYSRELDSDIPNGVISRFPIVESGEWEDTRANNRDFAWARIDLPGPRDLWVVSLHLLTSSSGDRASEAYQVVQQVRSKVPTGDYLVIGGDLNTGSRGESCLDTFDQVVDSHGPYPADHRGNTNTNANRSEPYDWVMADDDLEAHEVPVVIGSNSFDDGLVFDSRIYQPLADVYPVQRDDSDALNMQHMAVVRDFEVPRR